ncbi:hypothetical protein NITHO_3070012 [Nitrolancea hollandica Lb]|uniref:Uncharacterized protein n=1 Tax=Nitrolancea hollandica Lb TaxID=1129897 RepID=I4EHC4_9BACT|nr:hypothetical protein NITHO_3070012 [Nitrolancea hollandica Lb]
MPMDTSVSALAGRLASLREQ